MSMPKYHSEINVKEDVVEVQKALSEFQKGQRDAILLEFEEECVRAIHQNFEEMRDVYKESDSLLGKHTFDTADKCMKDLLVIRSSLQSVDKSFRLFRGKTMEDSDIIGEAPDLDDMPMPGHQERFLSPPVKKNKRMHK